MIKLSFTDILGTSNGRHSVRNRSQTEHDELTTGRTTVCCQVFLRTVCAGAIPAAWTTQQSHAGEENDREYVLQHYEVNSNTKSKSRYKETIRHQLVTTSHVDKGANLHSNICISGIPIGSCSSYLTTHAST